MIDEFTNLVRDLTARWPEHRVAPSLSRVGALCGLLGDPQTAMPVIMITGTNGKGATAIMVDALLRSAGLRTGRFTSPHLESVTERIVIDGQPISEEDFVRTWEDIAPYVAMVDEQRLDGVTMTFFEVITCMAYAAFADAPVDVAVVEVGMGGLWDATNIADAAVATVLPVALDHQHLLGDTLEAIATEKAGIIKPGARAVLAGQEPAVASVLMERCAEVGAVPIREGVEFGVLGRIPGVGGQVVRFDATNGALGELFVPAHGAAMARNAAAALATVEALLAGKPLGHEVLDEGFARVRLPGRLELARERVILDGAHNPAAAAASRDALLEAYTFEPLIGVVAMMRDKDVEEVLRLWEPVMAQIVCTQLASTTRCLSAEELAQIAEGIFGAERVRVEPSMVEAIDLAVHASEDDLGNGGVLVTGSVIASGEARSLLVQDEVDPEFDGTTFEEAASVDERSLEESDFGDHGPGEDS